MKTVTVKMTCPYCKKPFRMELDKDKYYSWEGGELILNVWPEMSIADRHSLLTGYHDECWLKDWKN